MTQKGSRRISAGVILLTTICVTFVSYVVAQEEKPVERGLAPVKSEPASSTNLGYTERHALIIGIDEYQDPAFPDLSHAGADATGIAKLLVEHLKFDENRVRLILNDDATKEGIERELEDWASDPDTIGENDLLVVFFAGHGETRDLGRRGKRGYIVPIDGRKRDGKAVWSSLVAMPDLEEVSESVPAKHVLFILDCCFGGLAVTRAPPPVAAGLGNRARQAMTAGNAEQAVLDGGGGGHSVFTAAVLDALRGQADLDGDKVVTFGELYNHVGRTVETRTQQRQTPLQATFPDHEGGCVALFPPGVKPIATTVADRLLAYEKTQGELLKEVLRLADVMDIRLRIEEADDLWPCVPEKVAPMSNWLVEAKELVSRRTSHEESLLRIRQEAYLKQVVAGLIEEGETSEPNWDRAEKTSRWRYETTERLLEELGKLDAVVADVQKRLTFARTVREESIEKYEVEWEEAITSIRDECQQYNGFELKPKVGLVPIGRDPDSGLWEFAHIQTGEIPDRTADGELWLAEEMGIVFVLIPGGTFRMGAQRTDPDAPNYDKDAESDEGPVHDVTLDPFFLSKYEMTQAQWERFVGKNPSTYRAHSYRSNWDRTPTRKRKRLMGLHPVEQVSWEDCRDVMRRLSLTLPTEAQWEYAARAGTDTVYFTGNEVASLQGSANQPDSFAAKNGAPSSWDFEEKIDDGYVVHAPVGRFDANRFGLHDVHGNVWEWCRDVGVSYATQVNPGDGERPTQGARNRVSRGGGFTSSASSARCAFRSSYTPEYRYDSLGLRPSRVATK